MALLFVDGFDHYTTDEILLKWTSKAGTPTINATGGRRGGGAYVASSHHGASKTLLSSYSSIICGMAIKPAVATGWALFSLYEGSTAHLTVVIETSGKLTIRRGAYSGTIIGTSNAALSVGTWYYIELKATINDTTGSTELRINGIADSGLTLTNVDTRNGGTGVCDVFMLGQISGTAGAAASYDDLYLCDTSGSKNNNFLGDCRIDTLYPDGAGNYTQFTSSNGANYTAVNKTTPANTPYVYSSNSGFRDSYSFSNLVSTGSDNVYAVQVNAYITKDDAGTREASTIARANSVDANGVSTGLSTSSFAFLSQVYETDPSANNWTQTSVNSAEFGVRVSV